jgi:chromosome segregation ATPase
MSSGIALFVILPVALISGWILATLIVKLARLERVQKASPGERAFNQLRNQVDELHHDLEELGEVQAEKLADLRARTVHTRQTMTQLSETVASLERRLDGVAVEVRTLLLEIDRLPGRLADHITRAQIRQAASGAAGDGDEPRDEGPLILS